MPRSTNCLNGKKIFVRLSLFILAPNFTFSLPPPSHSFCLILPQRYDINLCVVSSLLPGLILHNSLKHNIKGMLKLFLVGGDVFMQ